MLSRRPARPELRSVDLSRGVIEPCNTQFSIHLTPFIVVPRKLIFHSKRPTHPSSSRHWGPRGARGGELVVAVCRRVELSTLGVHSSTAMSAEKPNSAPSEPLFLTHTVARSDSLATIAIKYGVSIRDVKRANGGMISDATLHARPRVRIPRTTLAEGAPLAGGGGLTGAVRPKTGSDALEEMRKYYGTSNAAGSSGGVPVKSAGTSSEIDSTRHLVGGAQTATRLTRVWSGTSLASARGDDNDGVGPSSSARDSNPTENNTHGGGVSTWSFHGRDKALMSPATVKIASGGSVAVSRTQSAAAGGGNRNYRSGNFFAQLKTVAADVKAASRKLIDDNNKAVFGNLAGGATSRMDSTQPGRTQSRGTELAERKGKGD